MTTKISSNPRNAHLFGTFAIVFGGVLVLSAIVGMVLGHDGGLHEVGPLLGRALGGLVLIAIGVAVRRAAGLAGPGVVLDRERARAELLGQQRIATVKCAACGHLDEEGSKFCRECGRSM